MSISIVCPTHGRVEAGERVVKCPYCGGPTAWTRWRRARRLRAFHRRCDRLRIPDDVRVRLLKASNKAPDWYAGRRSA